MRMNRLYLCIATLLAVTCETGLAQAEAPRVVKTEMRLEGHCAKIFGRTRFSFEDGLNIQYPIAPVVSSGRTKASCSVVLRYTDRNTSKPVAGLTVQAQRLLSTGSRGSQIENLASVKTDSNGVAQLKLQWDEKSCGVDLLIYDARDPNQTNLTWPVTLLTRDAFFQINKCRGTFTSYGIFR
jgi:hypothetical protein